MAGSSTLLAAVAGKIIAPPNGPISTGIFTAPTNSPSAPRSSHNAGNSTNSNLKRTGTTENGAHLGAPQVQRVPGPRLSDTDFHFRLDVEGVPNDGTFRWEQFVSGSTILHHDITSTTYDTRTLPDASRMFGKFRDDIGKNRDGHAILSPGPHAISPDYTKATNINGHFTFEDAPGFGTKFGEKHDGKFVSGVTFNLEFQQKLWRERDGKAELLMTIQFVITGTRNKDGDTTRIIMVPTNHSGSIVEPLP